VLVYRPPFRLLAAYKPARVRVGKMHPVAQKHAPRHGATKSGPTTQRPTRFVSEQADIKNFYLAFVIAMESDLQLAAAAPQPARDATRLKQ
jgi:hypothetical protein